MLERANATIELIKLNKVPFCPFVCMVLANFEKAAAAAGARIKVRRVRKV